MDKRIDFTSGKIVLPLLKFVGPVLFALFLQAMYGAVDLMIVGKFAEAADVSAVSTGSQIMMTITNLMSSLAMGMTIMIGQKIGEKKPAEGGNIVGSGILLFLVLGLIMTVLTAWFAPQLAGLMHAPAEAFDRTTSYIRICGAGAIVIISYNLIGSIFRGIGDSNTPLVTVAIDCLLTCFLFCYIGFFNGLEYTAFVMLQGIVGAFLVRVPVSFFMSRQVPVSLFHIGLATPCSTVLQITLCFVRFVFWKRKEKNRQKY